MRLFSQSGWRTLRHAGSPPPPFHGVGSSPRQLDLASLALLHRSNDTMPAPPVTIYVTSLTSQPKVRKHIDLLHRYVAPWEELTIGR
jgi:hypothetical protein